MTTWGTGPCSPGCQISGTCAMCCEMTGNTKFPFFLLKWINSLWPGDTIWRHGTRSTLAQVMACCLTAPSHYLNQCWLTIRGVLRHSSENSFAGITQGINSGYEFEKDILLFSNLPGASELSTTIATFSPCFSLCWSSSWSRSPPPSTSRTLTSPPCWTPWASCSVSMCGCDPPHQGENLLDPHLQGLSGDVEVAAVDGDQGRSIKWLHFKWW